MTARKKVEAAAPTKGGARIKPIPEEFWDRFMTESDRTFVILVGAYVDEALRDLLVISMPTPSPTKEDRLFENDGPLATFSARITMAHRMGLLVDSLAKALHQLRRLRNDFAHDPRLASLETNYCQSRVQNILRDYDRHGMLFRSDPKQRQGLGKTSYAFRSWSMTIMRELRMAVSFDAKPLEPPVKIRYRWRHDWTHAQPGEE